jgi:hypothetical protein
MTDMNHSIRTIRTTTVSNATRNGLVHAVGGPLHIAFPNWLRNTYNDFSHLYEDVPAAVSLATFLTGRKA